jgi:hypothetical protein
MDASLWMQGGDVAIVTVVSSILAAATAWAAEGLRAEPPSTGAIGKPTGGEADDLALILARLKADFANPESTYPHDVHGPNSPRGSDWLATLEADGHWADIRYERFGSNRHLGRLGQMAAAYANPSSPDYHSQQVRDGALRALQYWIDEARPGQDQWWQNTVGIPQMLSRILVPLEDVLPAELMHQCLAYFTAPAEKDPLYSRAALSYPQQQLIRGALLRSADDVATASEIMQGILRVSTDVGVQRDFSFHQHGPQLYNGGYGLTLVSDMCNYATVLRGTRYAFARDKLMFLADHLLEGGGHMIRGKMLDYSVFGRTLLRRGAGQSATEFIAMCDQVAALLPERAAELTALKKHIEGTGSPYSFLGNRYFWNSDFMTHQREAYYLSVKMVSCRTIGTESFNGENVNGAWLPFGATWIARRGDEYNAILPVMDWGRLPGVTSPHVVIEPVRNVSQPEGFVGGVSDGTYGAASMVFVQSEPSGEVPRFKIMTRGRKAWFLFDREMVALGAGISSIRDEPVGTTLNQTALRGPVMIDGRAFEQGDTPVSSNSWVLHDEVGYTLLAPAAATVEVAARTSPPRFGRSSDSDEPSTQSVFSFWIDHGAHPRDARYAYAVVPAVDAQQLADWKARPPVRVIANTTEQQAVMNDSLGVAGVVFYRPGSIALAGGVTVKVDHACLVLLRKQGIATRVAVSSPGGEVFEVRLTIATPQRESVTTFALPTGDMAGKSQVQDVAVTW